MQAILKAAKQVYGDNIPIKPLRLIAALDELRSGADAREVARRVGTTAKRLSDTAEADDPAMAAFGRSLAEVRNDAALAKKVRRSLGRLLLGRVAETEFEAIYKHEMGTEELRLDDDREERNDTDYLVRNGGGRTIFRVNIKFFGSVFRSAQVMVGLDPGDCFALATYKINQGMEKQKAEAWPYLFVIVGVPDLTPDVAGSAIPHDLLHLCMMVFASPKAEKKRDVEDAIVEHMMRADDPAIRTIVEEFGAKMRVAPWYVLSARRADTLLRKLLFERVYAVRVRGFTQNYSGAEVDMHFSLKKDLTPLTEFLHQVKKDGLPKISVLLDRGDI